MTKNINYLQFKIIFNILSLCKFSIIVQLFVLLCYLHNNFELKHALNILNYGKYIIELPCSTFEFSPHLDSAKVNLLHLMSHKTPIKMKKLKLTVQDFRYSPSPFPIWKNYCKSSVMVDVTKKQYTFVYTLNSNYRLFG